MHKISQMTIDAIKQLSPETLADYGAIQRVPNKTEEYVCPLCNNGGNGNRDATGIKPKIADYVGWKCHRCGEKFDNIRILAEFYGLNAKTDFKELVEKTCAQFGISAEFDGSDNYKQATEKKSETPPAELNFINSDLAADIQPLKNFVDKCGSAWRGLPFELLEKFGCRYISQWTSPKTRAAQKYSTPTPRLIIPADRKGLTANYLARLTVPKNSFGETAQNYIHEKQHAGKKTLFNPGALKSEIVLAFEGYIDALSAELAGFAAVGLGGADSYQLLVDAVKNLSQKPKIIILLDADKTGRDTAPKLKSALAKVGCAASIRFLTDNDSKLDANQILVEAGVENLRERLRIIVDDTRADSETATDTETDTEAFEEKTCADDFNGYDFLKGNNTDLANARRLVKFRGENFRWLADDERWLTYDNGIWLRRSEKNSVLYPVAAQFSDKMFHFAKRCAAYLSTLKPPTILAAHEEDKSPEQKIYDKAEKDKNSAFHIAGYFERRKNYGAAIDLIKASYEVLIQNTDLNAHKNLLCCADCVVDLETGKTYDFAPDFLCTNQTAAAYNKNVDTEATEFVEKVLCDILPDDDTRRAVLRYLGYSLTGERNYQISQFWRGSGANGKSTILDTLKEILGSYVVKLPSAALLASSKPADGNAATPAIALLDGDKRLAIVDELPQKSKLDAAAFKTLVTDKTVPARPLYGNFRDIELRCKFIINGNFLPLFNSNDKAMRRRINTVEFTQSFEGKRADKNLLSKLTIPYAQTALLRILVAQAQEFYREGLLESDAMKKSKADYVAESDFITEFFNDACEIGDGFILRKDFESRLRADYPAETSQFSKAQLLKAICESLKPLGVEYTKAAGNKNIFKGVRWLHADDDDFDGVPISSDDYLPR